MKKRLMGWLGISFSLLAAHVLANTEIQQTRVGWLDKCPSEPEEVKTVQENRAAAVGVVLTAIGAKIIDGAVDHAAAALKAAGETKTVATTAKSGSDFYLVTPNSDLGVKNTCLVVVRGVFDNKKEGTTQFSRDSDEFKGLQRISFQLEAKVSELPGMKYFRLVPQYLQVEEFQDDGWFAPKVRDYTVALGLSVPGGAQPFGSVEMTFNDVTTKTKWSKWEGNEWQLRAAASLPMSFPPESPDATKVKTKREAELAPFLLAQDILETPRPKLYQPSPDVYGETSVRDKVKLVCDAIDVENKRLNDDHEMTDDRCSYRVAQAKVSLDEALEAAHRSGKRQAWAKSVCQYDDKRQESAMAATKCSNEPNAIASTNKTFTYVTTQVTLSETREGSKFAKFMGEALGAAKSDVSTALQSSLLPKSQAAKDNEESDARTARTSVQVADLEVKKADEGLTAALTQNPPVPVDITAARIALLKAKIAANDAYRKAKMSVPFPEIEG